jgi:hypothetical protein
VAYHYLVASLPLLTFDQEIPFAPTEFVSMCETQLSKSDLADVRNIVARRLDQVEHPVFRLYVAADTQLRSALARIRASRVSLDPGPFQKSYAGFSVYAEKLATEAMSAANPLERELMLDKFRWQFLDELVVLDAFGAIAVMAFAEKLLIVERWQSLTEEKGKSIVEQIVEANVAGIKL